MIKTVENPFAQDAAEIETHITNYYAYLERFSDEQAPMSDQLRTEAAEVDNQKSLLRYAERRLLALADHHVGLGAHMDDSWRLTPTQSDLWVIYHDGRFIIDAVRRRSIAENAGITPRSELLAVDGNPIRSGVQRFWDDLGLAPTADDDKSFAAQTLATGRRGRPRQINWRDADGYHHRTLPNHVIPIDRTADLVSATQHGHRRMIKFHDSLAEHDTIGAFDTVMQTLAPDQPITLDLTNTPSGGNTTVAKAIMGWFVTAAQPYQIHNAPWALRQTGVASQWIEQVLPRTGKHHVGPVRVLVGRWTGSMGEGIAVGMGAFGATIEGDNMAGLRGAIYTFELSHSKLPLNLPAERLYAVNGTPREAFQVPKPVNDN